MTRRAAAIFAGLSLGVSLLAADSTNAGAQRSLASPALVMAAGPTPSTWDGGVAVPRAPRWWPRGKSRPSAAWPEAWPRPVRFRPSSSGPLTGVRVALDPGHNIGNALHLSAINRTYWVGLTKTCNTTGTATNAGYPEASFNFDVVARVRRMLIARGASVIVTRDRNSRGTYGPCVGARGSLAAQQGADLMVSVHADGAPSSGRGFHVIAPGLRRGYTDDILRSSRVLARRMIEGLRNAGLRSTTYLSSPLSVRTDVGTLNTSDVPAVMVETLNMRNPADARLASTRAGRQQVALGIFRGIVAYLRTSS